MVSVESDNLIQFNAKSEVITKDTVVLKIAGQDITIPIDIRADFKDTPTELHEIALLSVSQRYKPGLFHYGN